MNLGDKMNFKKWFNEMVAMTVPNKAQFSLPCDAVTIKLPPEMQGKFPCQDAPVGQIDFRFEDYPNPPKLGMFSKFMAKLPKSTEYLIYHGPGDVEILPESQAIRLGYATIPEDWYIRAEFIGTNDKLIKPAMADFKGERGGNSTKIQGVF
jgi:hypothetical protein